jgi:hypothetical protein
MLRRSLSVIAAVLLTVGCQASSTTIIPNLPASTHFYVGNDNTPGGVLQYTLPLTAGLASNFSVASNNVVSVVIDPNGNMVVGDNAGHLTYFTTVLGATSTPAASFTNGAASNNGQLAFSSAGSLYAGNVGNAVNVFARPFTNASTPAQTITGAGLASVIGVGFDAAQNLYVANAGAGTAITCSSGAGSCSNLAVFAPPYTGAPIFSTMVASTAYRKLAVSSTQVIVANVAGAGGMDVYNLPLTAASAPAFRIANVQTPEGMALDASGNLYAGNLNNATVTVYTPPFSAVSAPSSTLTVSAGAFAIFGIAVGP